jgi:tRNA pseudouridine55 synthase
MPTSRAAERPAPTTPAGLLVVDKPAEWTSHDVVARVRRLARIKRVGHAGTLDPMATGVLLLGIGAATRLLGHLTLADKAYQATIRLGQSTTTDDAEGEPLEQAAPEAVAAVTDLAIEAGVRALTGPIEQVPAKVSAIKVNGQRAYAMVRAGEDVRLAARPVTVHAFDVHAIRRVESDADAAAVIGARIDIDAEVVCSSGTYVRALARDLGAALGVGGHLTALRRTRVGPYALDAAVTLDDLAAAAESGDGALPVLPLADAASAAFPRRDVDAEQARVVQHGGFLPAAGLGPGPVAVFGPAGELLALVEESAGRAKPVAVFAAA